MRLGRQILAAHAATCVQNLAASLGGHARTKAVAAFADQITGLIGAFHRAVPYILASRNPDGFDSLVNSVSPITCPSRASQFAIPLNPGVLQALLQKTFMLTLRQRHGDQAGVIRVTYPKQLGIQGVTGHDFVQRE